MGGLRNTKTKSGTKTPDFFSTCVFLYFLHLHLFISLNFFFLPPLLWLEYSRRSSGLSRIPTDTLSPSLCLVGTFRTVECKPQVNLDTSCTAVQKRKRKKGTFTFFCLSFFSDCWACCVHQRIPEQVDPLQSAGSDHSGPAREAAEPQTAGELHTRWVWVPESSEARA